MLPRRALETNAVSIKKIINKAEPKKDSAESDRDSKDGTDEYERAKAQASRLDIQPEAAARIVRMSETFR